MISFADTAHDWGSTALVALAIATVVVGLTDHRLHRSGFPGLSGATDALGLVVLGPLAAVLLAVGGSLLGHLRRPLVSCDFRISACRFGGIGLGIAAAAAMGRLPWQFYEPMVAVVVACSACAGHSLLFVVSSGYTRGAWEDDAGPQVPLALAQLSALALALVLFSSLGVWSLVLTTALLFLIRQSYTLLAEMSESYLKTVEVLVEAAEGWESDSRGHADRSAEIARRLAAKCGLPGSEVRRAGYAALLYSVGGLVSDSFGPKHRPAAAVIAGVDYFRDVLGVLDALDGETAAPSQEDLRLAYLVAMAREIDIASSAQGRSNPIDRSLMCRLANSIPRSFQYQVSVCAAKLGYPLLEC